MSRNAVLVAGSLNVDYIFQIADSIRNDYSYRPLKTSIQPGGHGANCASAAAKFGAATRLISVVGNDCAGIELVASLAASGVDCTRVATHTGLPTGKVYIPIFQSGEKFMIFDNEVSKAVEFLLPQEPVPSDVRVVVTLDVPKATRIALLKAAKKSGSLSICVLCAAERFTLESIPVDIWPQYVIGNAEEVRLLNGYCGSSTTKMITTLGRNGCELRDSVSIFSRPGFQLDSEDAVGAGDCFAGIFAATLATGYDEGTALDYANAGAAMSTTKAGAREAQPSLQAIRAFLDGSKCELA